MAFWPYSLRHVKLKRLSPPELNNNQTHKLNREDIETLSKEEVQLFLEKNSSRKNYNPFRITNRIKWENLKNSGTKLTVVEVESDFKDLKTRLILLKVQKEYFSRLIHTRTSGSQKDGFTGKIFISDLKGDLIKGYKLENGEFLVKYESKTSSKRTEECHWSTCIQELEETIVISNPKPVEENEYFFLDSGGNSEYDWDEAFNEPTWDFDDGLEDGVNSLSPELLEEEDAASAFEEQIDDAELEECLKKVLAELKNTNKGVGEIIAKFSGNIPGFNWKLQNGSVVGDANAQTSQIYDRNTGTVTTIFDSKKFSSASNLSAARSLLHESVHAYIVAFAGIDPINTTKTFPDLMLDLSITKYNNGNQAQHAEFVRNYLDDIAIALKQFGQNQGFNLTTQFYHDLAWGGLTQ